MGAFLSQLVGKLLGDSHPSEVEHSEIIDHNAIVCCGTVNVTEVEHDSTSEEKEAKR